MEQQFFVDGVTAHFNLRNPKSDKPTPIYLIIRMGKIQYKISLGCKVHPSHWDKKKQKAYVSPNLTELDNRNNLIVNNKISLFLVGYMKALNYICKCPDRTENIRDIIVKEIGGKRMSRHKKNALIELGEILDEQAMKDESRYGYHSELKTFSKFIKEKLNKTILYWDEFSLALLTDYEAWLHKQTVKHKITLEMVYLEDNTVIAKMQKIYTLLKYAEYKEKIDLTTTKICRLKEKKKCKDKTEENQIYLTEIEFQTIQNLKLDGDMEKVRDLFVFQSEVGQRFEDINGMPPTIRGDKVEIIQRKTNKRVMPKLTDTARIILDKYAGSLPKITPQKANKLLKEIAKRAGITRIVIASEMRNGKQYQYEMEGWQCVGTHTARRSFISNGLKTKSGSVLRKITGHNTTSAFERYNRLNSEDAADIVQNQTNTKQTINSISVSGTMDYESMKREIIQNYEREKEIEMQQRQIASQSQIVRIEEQQKTIYKDRYNELRQAVLQDYGRELLEADAEVDEMNIVINQQNEPWE